MRVPIEYRTASRQVYQQFCLAHPEVKITFKDWKEVLYTFNYNFRDYILETGQRLKMPYGFGYFAINKRKASTYKKYLSPDGTPYINLPIDWAKTKKAGTRIYHLNAHTEGYRFKWYWMSSEARFAFSSIWNFIPCRKTSRSLKDVLKKPNSPHAQIYKQWTRK